jgi:hypothetical protein
VPVPELYHLIEPVAQVAERLEEYPEHPNVVAALTEVGVVGAVLIVKEMPAEAVPY